MTLEELWELFPIALTEHNESWKQWAFDEIACLKTILGHVKASYHHIGSTAVNNIMSKPIIDIIIEIEDTTTFATIKTKLTHAGYICMSESESRLSLNKGYTPDGYAERVFHIHVRQTNDTDEIYFRDYLNSHTDVAKDYELLKLSLCTKYKHNRDGYTQAKTSFVNRYTELAKHLTAKTEPDPAQIK